MHTLVLCLLCTGYNTVYHMHMSYILCNTHILPYVIAIFTGHVRRPTTTRLLGYLVQVLLVGLYFDVRNCSLRSKM